MKRLLAIALLAGCGAPPPEVQLQIRLPVDKRLLASVTRLDLSAERDGRVLAQGSFPAGAGFLSVSGAQHGPRTTFTLEGVTDLGDVIGRGSTCPIDFTGAAESAALFFSPVNFFSPTVGAPLAERRDPVALSLDDGTVLVAGGADAGGALASAELYSPGPSRFAAAPDRPLVIARRGAQLSALEGIGALITGGIGADGRPVDVAELYKSDPGLFTQLPTTLDARAGHRAITLPDGRVLITGGAGLSSVALASTRMVRIQTDGSSATADGPDMQIARRDHMAVVAVGVPVVIGGYGFDGNPTPSIEVLQPFDQIHPGPFFQEVAQLNQPRAEATATLLDDGSILVVGGATDALGTPRSDAEVYNPITRSTTLFKLDVARRGHTATLLPSGRVLIVGGFDAGGNPLASVELFAPGVGSLSTRPLATPRAGHITVPLCDGTVLVAGGGPGAELYNPPAK